MGFLGGKHSSFLYKEPPGTGHQAHLPGIPGPCPHPAKAAMLSAGSVCSLLLLSVLWVDVAMAGSSFLSPEHQKAQRKDSKKAPSKLQPRALEGWLWQEDPGQEDGAEDQLEVRFNAPFDVGIKLSGAQYQQHGQALGKFLQDVLWEEAKEAPDAE